MKGIVHHFIPYASSVHLAGTVNVTVLACPGKT
jgi:hypothetical protein